MGGGRWEVEGGRWQVGGERCEVAGGRWQVEVAASSKSLTVA